MRTLAGFLMALMTACGTSSPTADAGPRDGGPPSRCEGCAATCGTGGEVSCEGARCEDCFVSCNHPFAEVLAAECTGDLPTCSTTAMQPDEICWRWAP